MVAALPTAVSSRECRLRACGRSRTRTSLFPAIEAAADDLARLLIVERADLGNDFFMIPIRLPVRSLTTVESLIVTDSFG